MTSEPAETEEADDDTADWAIGAGVSNIIEGEECSNETLIKVGLAVNVGASSDLLNARTPTAPGDDVNTVVRLTQLPAGSTVKAKQAAFDEHSMAHVSICEAEILEVSVKLVPTHV